MFSHLNSGSMVGDSFNLVKIGLMLKRNKRMLVTDWTDLVTIFLAMIAVNGFS